MKKEKLEDRIQKEIYLILSIDKKQVFELEVKGSPELMTKIIEEINGSFGVIYELKEQLKKYIEGTFKEKSSKLLKNYPPKKKEKKQIIFTQCF